MDDKRALYSLDESLGFWLYRSQTKVSAGLRQTFQEAGCDLTPEQWSVLHRLREHEGINQSQLGEITFKDRHNITRILKQLARRGYIAIRIDKNDKRAHRIHLSPGGRSLYKKAVPLVFQHRRRLCKGFTAEDLLVIRQYLERIVGNLNHQ